MKGGDRMTRHDLKLITLLGVVLLTVAVFGALREGIDGLLRDLGLWMVANGHALAYRRYSTDYAEQEDLARHTRRGLWAGSFVAPWDWRRGQR